MALQKQALNINFAQGLSQKSDPKALQPGQFSQLENTIFNKAGLLQKRNGYAQLASLPDDSYNYVTTFKGNLTAVGSSLAAFAKGSNSWINKGALEPVHLDTLTSIRSNLNQSQCDSAVSSNGFVCTVYTDQIPNGGSTMPSYKYVIADSTTGQNIIAPTVITPTTGTVTGSPRVFLLGRFFIIVFSNVISGLPHLQYIAINTVNPTDATANIDISAQYTPSSTVAFDGVVANNNLYLAWNGSDGGGAIRMTSIGSNLTPHGTTVFAGQSGNIFTLAADITSSTPVIYVTFYSTSISIGKTLAVNANLVTVKAPTTVITAESVLNLASTAQNGIVTFVYEVENFYSYDSSIATSFLKKNTMTMSGTVGTASVVVRSVGLASKAFLLDGVMYFLSIYSSLYQPTYFLLNLAGQVIAKLAYSNGGQYLRTGLPEVNLTDNIAQISYLIKDLVTSVNKSQGVSSTTGVYSQTGINLASFEIGGITSVSAEIGNDLHLSGGFLWMYDGYTPVEHLFHLWPDYVEATTHTSGGGMKKQKYFYQVTYEWSDNQGNVFKSAPSIPTEVDLTDLTVTPITFTSVFASGATSIVVSSAAGLQVGQSVTDTTTPATFQAGTTIESINGTTITLSLPTTAASAASPGDTLSTSDIASVTLNIPTLRLTYKTANPVKIVIYRWALDQQIYYQVTSLQAPLLNNTTVDSVSFLDTNASPAILGNSILYTNGGVLENIAAPATSLVTLFQSRLFLVDDEDKNLLWFSKQVIENTPVETSDLLTIYVAPTAGAQGDTGPITALSAMDDKLIIFKNNAIYYITGTGPDNTGANNQFSEPVFITSTVGCSNPQSIVFVPSGLLFQSDKGIWLLGRDLSTTYLGNNVEDFTETARVQSSVNIPGNNQVRFTLDTGITLMYDYFFNQWGTFVNVPSVTSTLYEELHTYINKYGQVYQENAGSYLDGSSPVLMSFNTGWLNLAGLQGYQRGYYFYLLGSYISPHKLSIGVAYDYNDSQEQVSIIEPDNYSGPYGSDPIYGSSDLYGGSPTLENWRVFLQRQKCEAFQISMQEIFDPQYGTISGAGLTLSGIDIIVGLKSAYPRLRSSNQVG